MNKVVTCNIAGLVFTIEEQAYEKLSHYLKMIKNRIARQAGADEIYGDVESRVAELFKQRMTNGREVVLESDVNAVQTALGSPEDFDQESDFAENQTYSEGSDLNAAYRFAGNAEQKRLMRDTDNAAIAGVCSGLAAYFGWQVVMVRIVFIMALILTGFGFFVYIVLWIATPAAVTASDRLKMKGKPVTVDTLTNEVQLAAERIEKYAHKVEKSQRVKDLKASSKKVGSVFVKIVGGFIAVGSFIGIVAFLAFNLTENGIFVNNDGDNYISLYAMSSIIFSSSTQSVLGWAGLLITVILPLAYLTFLGLVLLLGLSRSNLGRVFLGALMVWIVGIAFFSIVAIQIGRDFTFQEYVDTNLTTLDAEVLKVSIPNAQNYQDANDAYISIQDKMVSNAYVRVEISASNDSLYHISSRKYAAGITRKKAYKRIDNLTHEVNIIDSNLISIQEFFSYPVADSYRRQRVKIFIQVPEGKDVEWVGDVKKVLLIQDNRNSSVRSFVD